jgi:hypothetical protein
MVQSSRSPAAAQQMLLTLAQRFCVPIPKFEWRTRPRRIRALPDGGYDTLAFYHNRQQKIVFHPTRLLPGGFSIDDALLHEFTHHYIRSISARPKRDAGHTLAFYHFLHKFIEFWYGDASRYHWHCEYPHGYRYAQIQGWTRKTGRTNKATAAGHLALSAKIINTLS